MTAEINGNTIINDRLSAGTKAALQLTLDTALQLAVEGFWVFPIKPGGNTPAHKGWQEEATRDPKVIAEWFNARDYNVGIFTNKFGDTEALVVVDVDVKNGKDGNEAIVSLEFNGRELPGTRIHATPSGGRHIIYRAPAPIKQGANKLGMGLDIRSRGGYIVGPSSRVRAGVYGNDGGEVSLCPPWIETHVGASRAKRVDKNKGPRAVDHDRATVRARRYLDEEAPLATAGGRNDAAYKAAAVLKDFGLSKDECLFLMLERWRCEPMLDHTEIEHVVNSAYQYSNDAQGSAAPEADFDSVSIDHKRPIKLDPVSELNQKFAHVIVGGGDHILWETTDKNDKPVLEHLQIGTFHRRFAAVTIPIGKRAVPITEEWMRWGGRRMYDGIVFMPEQKAPKRFYNLWRGFSVVENTDPDSLPALAHHSLEMFLEHALENICQNDVELFNWLMGYFAHVIQRPWEKPLTALVFRGSKGVGKNALVKTIGALLGRSYLVTSKKRYLVGNFNSHLENLLMLVLDEAFWSGDKETEGVLKDLITGGEHVIERKGQEPYGVENRTRVVVIGNEDWVVPASNDERRFAVFEVGKGRKQDKKFFAAMEEGMELGGAQLLLAHLRKIDLTTIDINEAPKTKALLEQKFASFDPVFQWWNQCISEGRLIGADFGDGWPADVEFDRLRNAFKQYLVGRGIRARVPEARTFEKLVLEACSTIKKVKVKNVNTYRIPGLEETRSAWSEFVGHEIEWSDF